MTSISLPSWVEHKLEAAPVHSDKRSLAELLSSLFGPISYRTVEDRPFTWQISNGYAVTNTRAAVEAEYARFVAAPNIAPAGRKRQPSFEVFRVCGRRGQRTAPVSQRKGPLKRPLYGRATWTTSCSIAAKSAQYRHARWVRSPSGRTVRTLLRAIPTPTSGRFAHGLLLAPPETVMISGGYDYDILTRKWF